MSGRFAKHSVLRGGIDLWRSPTGTGTPVRAGVASAIAVRRITAHRKEKVLVTCRHNATGLTEPDREYVTTVPSGVEMYSGPASGDRVTNGLRQISALSESEVNRLDIAVFGLRSNAESSFFLHEHPALTLPSQTNHVDGMEMLEGATPVRRQASDHLVIVTPTKGVFPVVVDRASFRVNNFGGDFDFDGVFTINPASGRSETFAQGDSGSPVLLRTADGKYKIMGIHIGSITRSEGVCCPATLVESQFNLTFGNPPPQVVASASKARVPVSTSAKTETVTLDGSGTTDID